MDYFDFVRDITFGSAYRKFSNKAAPFIQNFKGEFKSFPTVYDMPIFNKIWVVINRWKALELCFSDKGAHMLCLGGLRPYLGIYGICPLLHEHVFTIVP